jgi:hypothetical protein
LDGVIAKPFITKGLQEQKSGLRGIKNPPKALEKRKEVFKLREGPAKRRS